MPSLNKIQTGATGSLNKFISTTLSSLTVTGNASVGGNLSVTGNISAVVDITSTGALAVDDISFNEDTAPAGTVVYAVRDNTGDLTLNALTSKTINLAIAGTDQVYVADGSLSPKTTNDVDLGTSSLAYKEAFMRTIDTDGAQTLTLQRNNVTMMSLDGTNVVWSTSYPHTNFATNTIVEGTAASGVTADGVLLKDSGGTFAATVDLGGFGVIGLLSLTGKAATTSLTVASHVTGGAAAQRDIVFRTGDAANPQALATRLTIGSNAATATVTWANSIHSGFASDVIAEGTSGTGVTIDGVLLKDSKLLGTLTIPAVTDTLMTLGANQSVTGILTCTNIVMLNSSGAFQIKNAAGTVKSVFFLSNDTPSILYVDSADGGALTFRTTNLAGSVTDRLSFAAGANTVVATWSVVKHSGFAADVIAEGTSATGVTVDSVLLKDGGITLSASTALKTDIVSEVTSAAGVTIDGVLLKDTGVTCDTVKQSVTNAYLYIYGGAGAAGDGGYISLSGKTAGVNAGGIDLLTTNADNNGFISRLTISGVATWGTITIAGADLVFPTVTGTKIGTATNQLIGFYGATPVDRPATVTDPSGGATVDAEARTAIIAVIDRIQELGLMA